MLKQIWQLFVFHRKGSFDIIHFFGSSNVGLSLSCLKYLGIKSRALFTPIKRPRSDMSTVRDKVMRVTLGRIDKIIATTEYVRQSWALLLGEDKCRLLRPGIMKDIQMPPANVLKNSVLFWRNAGYENGADLAMNSFMKLSPKYPNIRFVFAVRPHDIFEADLLELEQRVRNIDVHIYPYTTGISLASLLQGALFVVQPFRSLSVNPQMSILETLYAGVPIIATNTESNAELVQEGKNGLLIPPEDETALTSAIETLLKEPAVLDRLTKTARVETRLHWNWESFGKGLLRIYENTDN
jgi:glycosyltransferase involved in cell wall biosynthesis